MSQATDRPEANTRDRRDAEMSRDLAALASRYGWSGCEHPKILSQFFADVLERRQDDTLISALEWVGPVAGTVESCLGTGPKLPACPLCGHWTGATGTKNTRTGYFGVTVQCMDWKCGCRVHTCGRDLEEATRQSLKVWSNRTALDALLAKLATAQAECAAKLAAVEKERDAAVEWRKEAEGELIKCGAIIGELAAQVERMRKAVQVANSYTGDLPVGMRGCFQEALSIPTHPALAELMEKTWKEGGRRFVELVDGYESTLDALWKASPTYASLVKGDK